MIIDATDTIMGRVATVAAKKALLGEKVDIINCEKAVVSGRKKWLLPETKRRKDMGIPTKGPVIYRMPDRFVRRAIRGMLPHKKPRGREAFKRIRCYIGVPLQFKDQKAEIIKEASFRKLPNLKYTTVKQICKHLGGKVD
ncbi:MAG: 50S ribosomal protein L13 [archaeon]